MSLQWVFKFLTSFSSLLFATIDNFSCLVQSVPWKKIKILSMTWLFIIRLGVGVYETMKESFWWVKDKESRFVSCETCVGCKNEQTPICYPVLLIRLCPFQAVALIKLYRSFVFMYSAKAFLLTLKPISIKSARGQESSVEKRTKKSN